MCFFIVGVTSTATVTTDIKQMELKLTAYVAFHSSMRGIDHLTDLLNEHVLKKSVKLVVTQFKI
jgi:hypothetical protein